MRFFVKTSHSYYVFWDTFRNVNEYLFILTVFQTFSPQSTDFIFLKENTGETGTHPLLLMEIVCVCSTLQQYVNSWDKFL